ncbi:MAG: type II toxin-antitoxin system VapC family toxin [Terracidiphilus sp.]
MNDLIILDTSIVVDQIRTNCHLDRLLALRGLVRNSSVVLAELWRGISRVTDRRTVDAMERRHQVLNPTTSNWLESGQILAKIRDDLGFEPRKLRGMHFDVLIALTARSNGARLITSNRADFELIREYRDFKLEVW